MFDIIDENVVFYENSSEFTKSTDNFILLSTRLGFLKHLYVCNVVYTHNIYLSMQSTHTQFSLEQNTKIVGLVYSFNVNHSQKKQI